MALHLTVALALQVTDVMSFQRFSYVIIIARDDLYFFQFQGVKYAS